MISLFNFFSTIKGQTALTNRPSVMVIDDRPRLAHVARQNEQEYDIKGGAEGLVCRLMGTMMLGS
jgi:hypothetical protein